MLPMLSICNPDPTALCWHITHCSTEHHTPLLLSNRATPPSFPTCPSHRARMPRYTTVAHEAAALWFLLPAHHAACLYVHVLHLGISHSHMAEVSISHPPCCPLSKSISLLKSFSQQLNKTPGVPLHHFIHKLKIPHVHCLTQLIPDRCEKAHYTITSLRSH